MVERLIVSRAEAVQYILFKITAVYTEVVFMDQIAKYKNYIERN